MIDHNAILKHEEMEHGLEMMKIDAEHAKLRRWMVEKYGEEAVKKFEGSVKDGDGIQYCMDGHRERNQ